MKKVITLIIFLVISPFAFGEENLTLSDEDIENILAAYGQVQLPADFYDNSVKPGETYHIPSQEEVMELMLGQFDYRKIHHELLEFYHSDNHHGRLIRSQLDYAGFDNIEQFSQAASLMFAVSALITIQQYNLGGTLWNTVLDRAEALQQHIPSTTKATVARNLPRIHDFLEAQDAKHDRRVGREH